MDLRYAPASSSFDLVGADLYVTPKNLRDQLGFLQTIASTHPDKKFIIPELGIATSGSSEGVGANMHSGLQTLNFVLSKINRTFKDRLESVTPFSVDVKDRVKNRNWGWAWSPEMHKKLEQYASNGSGGKKSSLA